MQCCYKISAKILIDICQSAFLGNRNILDSVLIVNEVVEEAKVKNGSPTCSTAML